MIKPTFEEQVLDLKAKGWGRDRIARELGVTPYSVRKVLECGSNAPSDPVEAPQKPERQVEYKNGTYTVTGPLDPSCDLLDPVAVMDSIGLDPMKFELVQVGKGRWTYGESLRVVCKPRKVFVDIDYILERIDAYRPTSERIRVSDAPVGDRLLEIAIADPHFGENTLEDYEQTLADIWRLLPGKDTVVLTVGNDCLQANGFSYKTINDTQLEPFDLTKAWEDAVQFFQSIIRTALYYGANVHVVYIPANHDRDLAWAMGKLLEKMHPMVSFDLGHDQYKAFRYGDVAIGWTHGDEGNKKDYDRIFMRDFPEIFGSSSLSEIHVGHWHKEALDDVQGVIVRVLPTRTKRNAWAKRKGYHSVPRFQCFEYDDKELKHIHYV